MELILKDINIAWNQWMGKPAFRLELRRQWAGVGFPTEMDILFFQPKPSDGLRGDEFFTIIATAGMGLFAIEKPYPRVELALTIKGEWPRPKLEALGRKLAEMAVVPFRFDLPAQPNVILSSVELPLFESMNHLLYTHWGVYAPHWLPGLTPAVLVLGVVPLFDAEVDLVQNIGDKETFRRFTHENIETDDPKRAVAPLHTI